MSLFSGVRNFFGLDIGTTALRLVELSGSGPVKALERYAYVPVEPKIVLSDSRADDQKLAVAIKELVAKAGASTRNVAANLPSARVFTTVVDMDRLSPNELEKTLYYQADSLIPTRISESKIDWAFLGDSPADASKVEILLSSVSKDYAERRLDLLESCNLNVIALEPDSMALARAITSPEATAAQLVFDVGNRSADLVIALQGVPRLARSIPTGFEAIVKSASQNLNLDYQQAEQFVTKFGLSKDKLEGQIYQAIIGTVDILTAEIDKSIKFFQGRYSQQKIERIIVTGGAAVLPEFPVYLANKFGISVEIGNAWRNISFAASRQNELLAASSQFAVAAGLAERQE